MGSIFSSQRVQSLKRAALVSAKRSVVRTSIGRQLVLPKYRYMYSPEQLWALCQAAEQSLGLGAFAEIGVYSGSTTVFIHKHLAGKGPLPTYYCLDTFSGFVAEDVEVEQDRDRDLEEGAVEKYKDLFYNNSKESFEQTMALNGITNTVVIKADASTFDYSTLPPLGFVLVDVDLLRPVRAAMAGCWERLVPGGTMVVDDCTEDIEVFDGALQAYEEFCKEHGFPVDIRHGKLGYVTKSLPEPGASSDR